MAAIKSKNTAFEVKIFRALKKEKIVFKKHYKKIFGSPDIAFPDKKIAIFLDGDFWHGYQFAKLKKRLPKKFWLTKIENNIRRDRRNRAKLRRLGWKVLRIWEHEIKKNPERIIGKIKKTLA